MQAFHFSESQTSVVVINDRNAGCGFFIVEIVRYSEREAAYGWS